jgi:RNA polymerase sigma-70 factor (ECF subfamily)
MTFDVEACFRAQRARVYRWAYAMCGRHDDAADVVQEVFLRMFRKPPQSPSKPVVIAWLRRVTARVVIDRWRSETARTTLENAIRPSVVSDETAETCERARRVRAALASLSERQRLVVMAKCYDQMTFQQIADELGIATTTAKTHYLRGLAAVRNQLQADMEAGRL